MATFTVHVPAGAPNAARRAERTVFVREAFSLPAFLFGPLFLLYRRLWLGTVVWIVVAILIGVLAHALNLPASAQAALGFLLALMTGLEASALRQGSLARRGFAFAGLFSAPTREDAERAFFRGEGFTPPPPARSVAAPKPADTDVIGLFPNAGDRA